MSRLTDKLDAWYDRQSLDTLALIALAPLIFTGLVVLVGCVLVSVR